MVVWFALGYAPRSPAFAGKAQSRLPIARSPTEPGSVASRFRLRLSRAGARSRSDSPAPGPRGSRSPAPGVEVPRPEQTSIPRPIDRMLRRTYDEALLTQM